MPVISLLLMILDCHFYQVPSEESIFLRKYKLGLKTKRRILIFKFVMFRIAKANLVFQIRFLNISINNVCLFDRVIFISYLFMLASTSSALI